MPTPLWPRGTRDGTRRRSYSGFYSMHKQFRLIAYLKRDCEKFVVTIEKRNITQELPEQNIASGKMNV